MRANRSAHDFAARRGHDPRECRAHRPAPRRRRGHTPLQHRDRHRGPRRRQGLCGAEGPGQAGDRTAHTGAVRTGSRKALHPEPRADRRRNPRSLRLRGMSAGVSAVTMPKWGLTMTEGTVVGWLKQQGQRFAEGEEILEIETPKITNVVEAPSAGTLRRIVAQAGATLPIGALLAVVAPDEVPEAEIDAFVAGFAVVEPSTSEEAQDEGVKPRDIEVAGRRLRYLDLGEGDGAPVLLVHGFGADLNTWMFTQPALAATRRAVALDLPGHGGSVKDVGAGNAEGLTDAVEGVREALCIERVHLVGHSMGGAIATLAALRRPERVASLTLVASAGLGPEINASFIDGFVRASR